MQESACLQRVVQQKGLFLLWMVEIENRYQQWKLLKMQIGFAI